MKRTYCTYEHSRLGFPGVVLKWSETHGRFSDGYIVVNGEILKLGADVPAIWSWATRSPEASVYEELEKFDKWVVDIYGNNKSVQG